MDVENAMLLVQLTDGIGGGQALEVLHIVAYFASEDIDTSMFLELLGGSEETTNAVELLKRHSLVKSGDKETSIRIQKEVQEKVQKILKEQEKEEAVLKVAIGLLSKFLRPESFNHAISVFNFAKEHSKLVEEYSSFPSDIMQGMIKIDKDLEASNFGLEAFVVLKEFVGEYHPSTIVLQKRLGLALVCAEKPEEAAEVLIEAYKKISEIKGEKEVCHTLTLIAKILSSHTSEPETRVRQLVFGDVPVSDTNNNAVLNLWCEYALMLKDFKWSDEAMPILVQVLEKRRQLLHPNDDDICEVEDSIAHLHLKQNEFQKALEIFQKVYEERKTKLGEYCVKSAVSRRGMGEAYYSLGMLDNALSEYEAVAEIFRQVVGEDDTRYLLILGKIALILYRQKKLEESYKLYTEIYNKYVVVSGEKDMQTLNVKHNMGSILYDQDKIEEALSLWREVLEGYFETLGPQHPESLELMQKIFTITLRSNSGSGEKILDMLKNRGP